MNTHRKNCIPKTPCLKCNVLFTTKRSLEIHNCNPIQKFKPESFGQKASSKQVVVIKTPQLMIDPNTIKLEPGFELQQNQNTIKFETGLPYEQNLQKNQIVQCTNCHGYYDSNGSYQLHLNHCKASKTAPSNIKVVDVTKKQIIFLACPDCGLKFDSKPRLYEHSLRVHKKNKLFSCDKCGFTPSDNKQMLLHFEKCTNFKTKENLVDEAIKSVRDAAAINLRSLEQSLKPKPIILRSGQDNLKEYLCSKCDTPFCSYEAVKLHFNSCDDPRIRMLQEKLQSPIVEKFSCDKCDMEFNVKEAMQDHFENCQSDNLQEGEEHFDHTYSKVVLTVQNVKRNLFGIDEQKIVDTGNVFATHLLIITKKTLPFFKYFALLLSLI